MSAPRTLADCEDSVSILADCMPALHSENDQPLATIVILTCPRCGRVDRMTAASYAGWTEGVRCGLCGPPYLLMHVRLADEPV